MVQDNSSKDKTRIRKEKKIKLRWYGKHWS